VMMIMDLVLRHVVITSFVLRSFFPKYVVGRNVTVSSGKLK